MDAHKKILIADLKGPGIIQSIILVTGTEIPILALPQKRKVPMIRRANVMNLYIKMDCFPDFELISVSAGCKVV